MVSGYSASETAHEHGLRGTVPFLRKPWTLVEVLQGVRKALDAPVTPA
jgi:hypothetical protein